MKILFSLLFSITCVLFHAQNLVPNWSFEEYTTCPDHVDNIGDCVGWMNFAGSCDYYNSCALNEGMSTPNTNRGYQVPLGGEAYMGILARQLSTPEYREYCAIQLTEDLVIGETYFFSMYISRTDDWGNGAIDKFGVRFTTMDYNSNPYQTLNNAHISSDWFLTNSELWTLISGSFVADSAYRYLTIGNFYDDVNFPLLPISEPSWGAYYFVDAVRLSTDSIFALTPLNIDNRTLVSRASVSPNPVRDQLKLILQHEALAIDLFDISGLFLESIPCIPHATMYNINMNSFDSGYYIMRIQFDISQYEIFQILKL